MTFLQPWMWWALPAAGLPILIHLLNRLRYRTAPWAAMMFLLRADRAATRRARVRQYLLLGCRTLILVFLLWAMSRPLAGGWMRAASGRWPEAVLLLLDRSASMEARSAPAAESRRQHALSLFSAAAARAEATRFVLIENVLHQPLELSGAARLSALREAGPTDTAADLPAMFRAALEYLEQQRPGSSEVWVASDLQSSNWRPESAEWPALAARFRALPHGTGLRVLDLSSPVKGNRALRVKGVKLENAAPGSESSRLSLDLEFRSSGGARETIPLLVNLNGAEAQREIVLSGPLERRTLRFDLPGKGAGWGAVTLPADENLADNRAWFLFAPEPALRAAVVGAGPVARRLRLAAAPDPSASDRAAEIIPPEAAQGVSWEKMALVAWAGPSPSGAAAATLEAWVKSGGVLLLFPPGEAGASSPCGISWAAVEDAPPTGPWKLGAADEREGPLANTESGSPLPIAQVEAHRRQIPSFPGIARTSASFTDGRPFLLGSRVGLGSVFAFATLPMREWSNLGDGAVLLPAVQRLLALGGVRLAASRMAVAGEWKPPSPEEVWTPLGPDPQRDWRWQAGLYSHGGDLVGLNRPESEDLPGALSAAELAALLPGVNIKVVAGALEVRPEHLESEIWPAMLLVAMLMMSAEMLLAPDFRPRREASPSAPAVVPARAAGPVS